LKRVQAEDVKLLHQRDLRESKRKVNRGEGGGRSTMGVRINSNRNSNKMGMEGEGQR
jgi:hypothetical protein